MLLEYDFALCTRRCAASGRALAPGEICYSTLQLENGSPVRRDYAAESWTAPPAGPGGIIAWWQSRIASEGQRARLAPQDVLLNLFAALAGEPEEAEFRYVLGLLLVRRRLAKIADARRDANGEILVLDCPRRDEQFELRIAAPTPERMAQLDQRLSALLYDGQEGAPHAA